MRKVAPSGPVIRASGPVIGTATTMPKPANLVVCGTIVKEQRTTMPAQAREQKQSGADARLDGTAMACANAGLADLILVRVAAEGGATRSQISRDLAPYTANKLSPAEWRNESDSALVSLMDGQFIKEKRGRFSLTDSGSDRAQSFLVENADLAAPWQIQRDVNLVATALGVAKLTAAKRKALPTPDGLRAQIIQHKFNLGAKKCQTPASTRAALAVVALERAFGKKIKAGLGEKTNLPAKASRVLAGQLLNPPKEFSTDTQLVAHIAAEQVEARQTTVEELRQALLSQLAAKLIDGGLCENIVSNEITAPEQSTQTATRSVADVTRHAANDRAPAPLPKTETGAPDLAHFSRIVNATASSVAEGWPGNMKAFISRVWTAIRGSYANWGLTESDFKNMLIDAHRAGTIVLSGADLKNKTDLEDFEKSQTKYKNTVWHFIRVDC